MESITVLRGKRILLGVTGSIAGYKSIDLASKLTQGGAEVDVIMTESATRFVTPLAFRSVTGRPVYTDMWELDDHVRHVGLGESAELMLIAPATANTIARLAHGMADNLLSVTALAARCPLIVAPAMDGGMWSHPATQANITILRERGVAIVGPTEGRMASGLTGLGRMVEPQDLLGEIRLRLGANGSLAGRRVIVSTGPTREAVDPVRFISNRSSGKQGIAVAQAALDAGAQVILVAGPTCEEPPYGSQVIDVQTTQEMGDAILSAIDGADILMMVAAVADFRPNAVADRKIKKTENADWGLAIGLEKTLDILTAVKERRDKTGFPRVVLGFAAETHNAFEYGREKLLRKGLNFIAVNDVTAEGAGFAVDTNRVVLLSSAGVVEEMPLQSKTAVAERLIHHVTGALGTG
ncbi:MAG: bifunctional phosphopantothenoylcysteine decarboxylase/phosphopantothenate--cysteine ligase CoaBC [Candidatus Promineofilum sp.]|nr:bifunctional phosphopantothenoylcysteine decarboxylase/phosphopantothenate--cysteine ligase CoaBC [Promineifilum sp.]MBP9657544.1 bifunctional phosphopantothenoylcysteine decarboxylase/phosphopantothenate--cysteine ligase CoaBC [Promineifilum sp.]